VIVTLLVFCATAEIPNRRRIVAVLEAVFMLIMYEIGSLFATNSVAGVNSPLRYLFSTDLYRNRKVGIEGCVAEQVICGRALGN